MIYVIGDYYEMYYMLCSTILLIFFFFNDTATTEIYTLSLHDALPICPHLSADQQRGHPGLRRAPAAHRGARQPSLGTDGDRKSTRLNSSHGYISYAVFCLKKKKILFQVYPIALAILDSSSYLQT